MHPSNIRFLAPADISGFLSARPLQVSAAFKFRGRLAQHDARTSCLTASYGRSVEKYIRVTPAVVSTLASLVNCSVLSQRSFIPLSQTYPHLAWGCTAIAPLHDANSDHAGIAIRIENRKQQSHLDGSLFNLPQSTVGARPNRAALSQKEKRDEVRPLDHGPIAAENFSLYVGSRELREGRRRV